MSYIIRPTIHNVVTTASLEQKVKVTRFVKIPCCTYDEAIYGGRCGYVKTPDMTGRVTVFFSGKMISVGAKSIKSSIEQLNQAKFLLVQKKMVKDILLKPMVRNIVATATFGKTIPVDIISTKITGAIYDPETFPGMILRGVHDTSLVFSSGKIVITGTKSASQLNTSAFELIQRLNGFLK